MNSADTGTVVGSSAEVDALEADSVEDDADEDTVASGADSLAGSTAGKSCGCSKACSSCIVHMSGLSVFNMQMAGHQSRAVVATALQ